MRRLFTTLSAALVGAASLSFVPAVAQAQLYVGPDGVRVERPRRDADVYERRVIRERDPYERRVVRERRYEDGSRRVIIREREPRREVCRTTRIEGPYGTRIVRRCR